MQKQPKDLEIEGKPRMIKDEIANIGQWKARELLFSEILDLDMSYCEKLWQEFPETRRLYNYICNSDKFNDYMDKKELEEQEKEQKAVVEEQVKKPKSTKKKVVKEITTKEKNKMEREKKLQQLTQ